jgi:hypothetical protein
VKEGKCKGQEKVSFSHSNSDKTHKLSLVNYNLCELGTGANKTDIISDPHDHLCTVRLLKYHIKHNLPPYWQGLLYLGKAKTEELKRRRTVGIKYIVDSDPTSATDSTPRGKFGPSFLSKQLHQLAIMCKFDNAEKFTWRSARRGSILKMASRGVTSGEILGHARHKLVPINTLYQSQNMSTSDHRNSCFMIGEKSTGTTSTNDYKPPYAIPACSYIYVSWECTISTIWYVSHSPVPCTSYLPQSKYLYKLW